MNFLIPGVLLTALIAAPAAAQVPDAAGTSPSPLAIGETFTIASKVLNEQRRINVYVPELYGDTTPLPVLYMPDGGIGEDFLHVAGLVQISVMNGTMRPFMLVGIENTQRRRDLTGPTENPEDRKIAPQVGGSAAFRRFLRDELIPTIDARYRTSGEKAIIGESLAGLFIVETFLLEPLLFDTYIAFDPSLWWNNARLVNDAPKYLRDDVHTRKKLYLASSSEPEIAELTKRLADVLNGKVANLHYRPMPDETHATIYHPAALGAVRQLFAPEPDAAAPSSADTLSIIDVYGVRKVSEADVRAALGVRIGDVIADPAPMLQRLRALPGVADADISTVCCADRGGWMMFVGIRETGTPAPTFRAAPTGRARLSADIMELGEAFDTALLSAVKRGVAGEDGSQGYALAQDSATRAIQQQFIAIAAKQMDTLRSVLRTSADAEHRALAAYIMAYGADRQAVVRDLLAAINDPDNDVRNNAVRAIGVLANWLNEHPDAGITIPAAPFLDLLNSVSWTDRNKGVMVTMALTAKKDVAIIAQLRSRALPSLIEMARWTNPGHAFGSWLILSRMVGMEDGTAFQAWQEGRRDEVIRRAEALH